MADIPTITFKNDLPVDVLVYDSFVPTDATQEEKTNYFGRLTLLGTAEAHATSVIQPIHTSTTFILDNSTDRKPVKRCEKKSYHPDVTSFDIGQADADAMAAIFKFIDLITKNPGDALAVAFQQILNDKTLTLLTLAPAVNNFFNQYPEYAGCIYEDYMMGIAYVAQNPAPVTRPPDQLTYSLSKLVVLMGGKWPEGMPDIAISNFTISSKNDVLDIWANVEFRDLLFETDGVARTVDYMHIDYSLQANFQFNYGLNIGIFGTRLTLFPEVINIPCGKDFCIKINPSVTIDINPLFKFVVFTIRGIIPFNIFGKQFDANISMVIHNAEAEVGVVIEGDHSFLPPPPIMKGVHFDEFAVGVGVFFEPPGLAIGVQGKFHIGDPAGGNVVALNDDTFALVCKTTGDIPAPVYISFYVPQMDINKVIEIFTNASPNINIPVAFTDLSFRWAANPMEPYTLPDGTLSQMGYGFSAAVNIFSFVFYGDVDIDINNGLTADVEMSPLSLGPIFKLSGDGKGVTIKVDQDGNPIKNNQIRDKKVLQDALAHATDKQLVAPGGPVLIINTFKSPILHLNGKVSLFEIVERSIEADINKDGILFQLDFGGILKEQMTCQLSDFHNFYGGFKFGIDHTFSLPTILGISLGSIHVEALCEAHIIIQTSLSDIVLKIGGSFDFEGRTRMFGDFSADIHISKISGAIEAIITNLADFAEQIFADIIQDAKSWAQKAKQGLITGYHTVVYVLKNAYNKTANEAASIMKATGYEAHQVASEVKDAFSTTVHEMAAIMKFAGYSSGEIAAEAKTLYNLADFDVAYVLKMAGYAADEVASVVKNTFNLAVQGVETALKRSGYAAQEVISALKNTFNIKEIASSLKDVYALSVNDINSFLQSAGYTADEVKNAFEALGGEFADFAKNTWGKISNPDTWNPSKW